MNLSEKQNCYEQTALGNGRFHDCEIQEASNPLTNTIYLC